MHKVAHVLVSRLFLSMDGSFFYDFCAYVYIYICTCTHAVCVCKSVVFFIRAGMQAGRFFYVLLLIVVPAR